MGIFVCHDHALVRLLGLVGNLSFDIYVLILDVHNVVLVVQLVDVLEAEGVFEHLT